MHAPESYRFIGFILWGFLGRLCGMTVARPRQ